MQSRAIFLDRDGVIVRDNGVLTRAEQIDLFPGVPEAIAKLRTLDFKIIMISNQTVVSRGLLTYDEMLEVNQQILNLLIASNPEARFDAIYFSPFHPSAQVEKYRRESECRKPRPGMILKAQEEFNINLLKSFVVGDRLSDVYAGNSVGCQTILLETGAHQAPLIETSLELDERFLTPHFRAPSLLRASEIIERLV